MGRNTIYVNFQKIYVIFFSRSTVQKTFLGRVRQIYDREIFKKPVRDVLEKLKLTVKYERCCFKGYDRR